MLMFGECISLVYMSYIFFPTDHETPIDFTPGVRSDIQTRVGRKKSVLEKKKNQNLENFAKLQWFNQIFAKFNIT